MVKEEFRKKYNYFLKEFYKKYCIKDRLDVVLNKPEFIKEINQAKSNEERIVIISAKFTEIEMDQNAQLLGYMLEKFLNVKN